MAEIPTDSQNPLAPMDTIAVFTAPDAPYPPVCEALVGFQIILFFQPPLTMESHCAIMDAVQEYYKRTKQHLVSGQPLAARNHGPLKNFKKINEPMFFRNRLQRWLDAYERKYKFALPAANMEYNLLLTSAPSINEPGHFSLSVFMPNPQTLPYLGYLTLTFPGSYIVEQEPNFIFALMHQLCYRLQPYHGMAGYAVLTSLRHDVNSHKGRYVTDFLEHSPGLNFINYSSCIRTCRTGILSVSWLNYINKELVERLGGRQKLATQCTPRLLMHDLDEGLLVQAGHVPQIGDAIQKIGMMSYSDAYKILKPIIAVPDKAYLTYEAWGESDGIYSSECHNQQEMENRSLHWPHRFAMV